LYRAVRFISVFLVPISQSAPQIYLSALPFTPKRSLIGEKFHPRFPNTLTISDGRPSQWPKNIFVSEQHHKLPVECIVLSPDENTFVSTSLLGTLYVCDSETGHCISGPFQSEYFWEARTLNACFSPDGKHILVIYGRRSPYHAVVWEIERGEKIFQIKGFDFAFIHCGQNKGKIASVHRIDEDGSLIRTIASTDSEDQGPRSTRILVKLWDIGNDISGRMFEVTDVAVTRFGMAIARFSPNGQYLAVGKRSENVVELWNLEDGKSTHRFPYPLDDISSLHFSLTSDCLMAAFRESDHKCLWRLDTQEMSSFNLDVEKIPPAIIHLPNASRLVVSRDNTVEIWEVFMSSSKMIFKTEPLTTLGITSICPLGDGHRLLVGSNDGTVRMWNIEDVGRSQPVIQDVTDRPEIIGFSPSGKMVATKSRRLDSVEFLDTTTWELVGSADVEYKDNIKVAFSADDKRIAVLTRNRVTICDIMHSENRTSFDCWPKGRHFLIWDAAFQTCNDLVIYTKLEGNSGLLQVWKLKDHSECTFSLDFDHSLSSKSLAPDGLTLIIDNPILCHSWNQDTAQFSRIHFTDEMHLFGFYHAYSPDGKLFACHSRRDSHVRVWDTRTGQLCSNPITMPGVREIALSPALNDQSLGDRIIALRCLNLNAHTVTLFDVYTSHLYAQCWDPGWHMAFIGDGKKLVSYSGSHPTRIYDIVDLAAKHWNASHGYEPVPKDMKDGWMVGQDDELLFWVPLEHREDLCLPHIEMIGGRPVKMDFSRFRYGSKWTECIDEDWLKQLEEREKEMTRLLE